jgi:hypothetical protein
MTIKSSLTLVGMAFVVAAFTKVTLDKRRQDRDLAELRRQVADLSTAGADADQHGRPIYQFITAPHSQKAEDPSAVRPPTQRADAAIAKTSPEEEATRKMIAMHERFEDLFGRDHQDAEWAHRAQAIIDQKLSALLPEGSRLRSFECHASMCRLETSHKSRDSYWDFIERAMNNSSTRLWNAETYSTPLNDDLSDGLLVSYIAREDLSFPKYEQPQ